MKKSRLLKAVSVLVLIMVLLSGCGKSKSISLYTVSDGIMVESVVQVSKVTASEVITLLADNQVIAKETNVSAFKNSAKQITLDLSSDFAFALSEKSEYDQMLTVQCVADTFLKSFNADSIIITCDKNAIKIGETIYDFPLRFDIITEAVGTATPEPTVIPTEAPVEAPAEAPTEAPIQTPDTSKQSTKYVAGSSVNVRDEASTAGNKLAALANGASVTAYSEANGWTYIQYAKGKYGYISSKYLSDTVPTATPTPNITTSKPIKTDGKKYISITFDDGPSAEYTRKIVDKLKEHNATATFFVVGNRFNDKTIGAMKYAVENGSEIQIHGFTHNVYYNSCSDAVYDDEISKTANIIKKEIGTTPTLMRPIGGSITKARIASSPYSVINWDVDSEDWKHKKDANCDTIVNNVMSQVGNGKIILMHEIYQNSYDAFCIIIDRLYEQGYEVVSVTNLFGAENLKSGTRYYNAN